MVLNKGATIPKTVYYVRGLFIKRGMLSYSGGYVDDPCGIHVLYAQDYVDNVWITAPYVPNMDTGNVRMESMKSV